MPAPPLRTRKKHFWRMESGSIGHCPAMSYGSPGRGDFGGCVHSSVDCPLSDAQALGDLCPGQALFAQGGNPASIRDHSRPPETLTLRLRVSEPGFHSLHDKRALELCHGGQDSENHLARWRGGVRLLSETREFDSECFKRFERPEKVRDAPGEPVKLPNRHHVKLSLVRIGHEPVELRPAVLRAADRLKTWPPDSKTRSFCQLFTRLSQRNYAVVALPHRSGLILPSTCSEFAARSSSIPASCHGRKQ